uniref:SS18 N-terminal domain-containing protein n=1 Tax=Oryza glumipatula TaxID=40148 RepID=A0A0E0BSZ2_9ORYZ
MQQQPMPMPAQAPPTAGITTEQIQKYLDENKQLILAILENQNLGKLAECAQYVNGLL